MGGEVKAPVGAPGPKSVPFGWTDAPEELTDFNPTELEEHLRLTMQGPDAKWLTNHHQAKQQRAPLPDSTPELARRKEVMHEIDTDPALQHVAKATGLLGCYLRNRVRAAKEDDTAYDVEALTAHAVDFGSPELAEAAEAFMKQHYSTTRQGRLPSARPRWAPSPGARTMSLDTAHLPSRASSG